MPGATLTIEKNVEVHVWPNVRILVLGNLIADGTLWQPISFKPINVTELAESQGRVGTQFRRRKRSSSSTSWLFANNNVFFKNRALRWRNKRSDLDLRLMSYLHHNNDDAVRRRSRRRTDEVFRQFPEVVRDNPQFQRLGVQLMENGTRREVAGFLHFYNATSGEIVPSCDVFFTVRNAQVVCR
jgi:hypothetical protein